MDRRDFIDFSIKGISLASIASLNPLRKKEDVKKVREKWMKELKKKK